MPGWHQNRARWANATAAAWPTFRESTPSAIGMRTRRVAAAIAAADSPGPSAPSSTATRSGTSSDHSGSAVGVGGQGPRLEPGAVDHSELVRPGNSAGHRQEEHLAHAHPDGAAVVRIDAVGIEDEAADAEGPRRAGDGTEVLGIVEALEDGEAAWCRRRRRRGWQRPAVGGGDRTPVEVEADGGREHGAWSATYTGAARSSRAAPKRARACGVTSTERTRWPDASRRATAVTPSATNSSVRSSRRRAAGSVSSR